MTSGDARRPIFQCPWQMVTDVAGTRWLRVVTRDGSAVELRVPESIPRTIPRGSSLFVWQEPDSEDVFLELLRDGDPEPS